MSTTKKNGHNATNQAFLNELPIDLQSAIQTFVQNNTAADVRDDLFNLLHYAMASPEVDSINAEGRSNLFFTIKCLLVLSDAIFIEHKNHIRSN